MINFLSKYVFDLYEVNKKGFLLINIEYYEKFFYIF